MDYSEAEMQAFQWEQSYAAILAILNRHGVENAFGEGDFWLLDDNYGCREHLVYVFRMAALRQGLAAELQSLLRAPALEGWSIRIALDLRPADGEPVRPEGIIVFAHAVEEHWNRHALHARFGDAFHWAAGWDAGASQAALAAGPAPDIARIPDPAFHAEWLEGKAQHAREHAELVALLEAHAGQAMSPAADFAVVNEPDEASHMIVLRDTRLLTRALADRLSALLRSEPWWGQPLMLALDLQSPGGQALPREAVMLSGDMVMAAHQAVRLKEVFGDSFDWSNALEDLD